MTKSSDDLIKDLVEDLQPVQTLKPRLGMGLAMGVIATGLAAAGIAFGLRADISAGHPDPMFLLSAGIFLVLAIASAWRVVDIARPQVGNSRDGWAWTALMASVLPLGALVLLLISEVTGSADTLDTDGRACMGYGLLIGTLTAVTLTLWLRRGAPTSPERAGLLAGVASGAAGILAVSFFCPHNELIHIGIWHGLTVVLYGLLGRFVISRLIRW
jgi:hypothetical protein